jgi:hypothetical protein
MNHYLSIIAASRNDDHGSDLINRTSAFVNSIYYQAKKWKMPVELIIVEWNPPDERAPLSEVLPKPQSNTPVILRFIVVPKEIHSQYIHSSNIPLYQMIAKNVGIRRAIGKFILCTNVDIIFSDECFEFISQEKLSEGNYYRAIRADVPKEVLSVQKNDEQLVFCKKNAFKYLGKLRGAEGIDDLSFLFIIPRLPQIINSLRMSIWRFLHPDKFPHFILDTMACGDFTLMSKQDWLDIEGYVELDMYSIHIDSMALWAASALGKVQNVFPRNACIYHVEHENGWESQNALQTIRFISQKPCIDYGLVIKGGLQIIEQKQTWKLNNENWGFYNINLKEIIFNA